ncbi:emp24/gp25L/p24 family/GOLD-domain-containing protein [Entophlyctis helioformis]|nr:emp24/gp25L/p24 family/GOLD-domain-containing protein [Entophlyctis helioformis]
MIFVAVVPLLLALVTVPLGANALHFYTDAGEKRCFSEDLPSGTRLSGAFKAELWNAQTNSYVENAQANVHLTVNLASSPANIVSQMGSHKGKFSFTAADPGDHHICLSVTSPGWFGSRAKVYLDIQFAETEEPEADEHKKTAYSDLTSRIRDLSNRVQQIRGELRNQRDREAEFRDSSEVLNTSALRWTIVQMIVLGITCIWQLRHLRQFFLTKKLV